MSHDKSPLVSAAEVAGWTLAECANHIETFAQDVSGIETWADWTTHAYSCITCGSVYAQIIDLTGFLAFEDDTPINNVVESLRS